MSLNKAFEVISERLLRWRRNRETCKECKRGTLFISHNCSYCFKLLTPEEFERLLAELDAIINMERTRIED